ncbi:PhzF family phenazine biosynthesis protein [Sphingorhabdus sp.]|jgi:PhzF family phenazine biosynthesis protein|uniref:PhzF family phenazine biosynthesis protein n=1 Tax=Sphingorhabdus sp. TaxID=1902408 RepID=UPI002FD91580
MTDLPYYHVDAFADRPFTGNQAAVMPLTHWLDDAVLQAIGEENNFAETAFYVPDETGAADYELRWFTPEVEIRLCGHATLASGHIVLSENPALDRVTFRTRKAGILEVRREGDGYAVALPAIPTEPFNNPEMMQAMGGNPLSMRSNPDSYNMFVYATAAEILALKPDMKTLATLGDDSFTATARGQDTDIVSRVFVPGAGVDEDSVTGSAHAVLTPYWAAELGRDNFTAYQASARGGYLGCRLDGERVWLSGHCFTVVKGMFSLG